MITLAIRRNRTWWTRVLPAVVPACAAVVAGLKFVVDHVWRPWPEPLPAILVVWAGAVLVAACLAVVRLRSGRWLPVVVPLPGQPGSPRDWFDAGRLTERLDAFAREHDGLAPIVVVADQLGARMANPPVPGLEAGAVRRPTWPVRSRRGSGSG